MTKSFGWQGNEGGQQQDIHELNRVLFEALENCLKKTAYDSLIQELYFGMQNTLLKCSVCNIPRKTPEPFLDLQLQVEGISGVNESLDNFFTHEELEGVNCDNCNAQTAHTKGPLISKLPPVLTFSLNRIGIDFTTWDRKKINSRFEYPLELDMTKYTD